MPPADVSEIADVRPGDERFDAVLSLAASILKQDRYLTQAFPHAAESYILGAFRDDVPVGFLRLLIQVIGSEEGRPPVISNGGPLTEGYVEAFGVDPSARRGGVGSLLQEGAIERARSAGCYQMRSRSPVTSTENYHLKVAAGYVMSPSEQNDSYYFLFKL